MSASIANSNQLVQMLPVLLGSFALFLVLRVWKRRSSNLPPGPGPLPFLGNIFDWPWESGWVTFFEWSKVYGDIVHVEMLGVHIIILNTIEAAQDLMNQAIYSDRPALRMVGDLMGFNPSIVLAPYGDHWKGMRRLVGRFFGKGSVRAMIPSIVSDDRTFVHQLLENPEDWRAIIRYILGKNFIANAYGLPVNDPRNKYIILSQETHEAIQHAVTPGNYLVDTFPLLKYVPSWFPGASFKHIAEEARVRGVQMVNMPFNEAKDTLEKGSLNGSMVHQLLHDPPRWDGNREEYEFALKWAAGSLYGAGTESSTSSMETFILLMALHPDIQAKAQQESDAVTNGKRLPEVDDRDNLPYMVAVMKEVWRFHPPNPLGVAHSLRIDDVYKGYHLPKNSIVMANIWGMSKDPRNYKDPDVFRPERFIVSEDQKEAELDPAVHVFGFGRRICQGIHYANIVLFLHMATIISVFDIVAGEDENGQKMKELPGWTGGFVSHAKEFPVKFIPRSESHKKLILSAVVEQDASVAATN